MNKAHNRGQLLALAMPCSIFNSVLNVRFHRYSLLREGVRDITHKDCSFVNKFLNKLPAPSVIFKRLRSALYTNLGCRRFRCYGHHEKLECRRGNKKKLKVLEKNLLRQTRKRSWSDVPSFTALLIRREMFVGGLVDGKWFVRTSKCHSGTFRTIL